MLKPIDLYVVLKLSVTNEAQTYEEVASALELSTSQVYRAAKSAQQSGLIGTAKHAVHRQALHGVLVHAVRYIYPAQRGATARGVPTAHAAPPLNQELMGRSSPMVWPSPSGTVRGESIVPLYKHAPEAALRDEAFYEVLALVDALRVGRARERKLAEELLAERLIQPRRAEAGR